MFWTYWYFYVPDYLLAALLYTLLGRFVLGFFVAQDSHNPVWRTALAVTDWIVGWVRTITPLLIGMPFLLLAAAFWVFAARAAFALAMVQAGLAPQIDAMNG